MNEDQNTHGYMLTTWPLPGLKARSQSMEAPLQSARRLHGARSFACMPAWADSSSVPARYFARRRSHRGPQSRSDMWTKGHHLVACLSIAVLVATAESLPSSSNFLHTQCDGHRRMYQPIIDSQLAAYRAGLKVKDILQLDGPPDPIAMVYNNSLMARQIPALNMAAIWVPLVKQLMRKVILPDLVLAGNTWDTPEDDTFKQGGPWFGFCNLMFMTSNLLLPSGSGLVSHLRCGEECWPFTDRQASKAFAGTHHKGSHAGQSFANHMSAAASVPTLSEHSNPQKKHEVHAYNLPTCICCSDHRIPKAIFLGSSTGWERGRRQAVVLAGQLHNETVQFLAVHTIAAAFS